MGFLNNLFGRLSGNHYRRGEQLCRKDLYEFQSYQSACFRIDDVFSIHGRGTVVVGNVMDGTFSVGDKVCIRNSDGEVCKTEIVGIELFRKLVGSAGKGENAGFLLNGIERNLLHKDDLIIK